MSGKKRLTEEERIAHKKAYMARYRLAHKDEIRAKEKAYKEAHKEQSKERQVAASKAYYLAHRDEIRAKVAAYREEHRDDIAAKKRARYGPGTTQTGTRYVRVKMPVGRRTGMRYALKLPYGVPITETNFWPKGAQTTPRTGKPS